MLVQFFYANKSLNFKLTCAITANKSEILTLKINESWIKSN